MLAQLGESLIIAFHCCDVFARISHAARAQKARRVVKRNSTKKLKRARGRDRGREGGRDGKGETKGASLKSKCQRLRCTIATRLFSRIWCPLRLMSASAISFNSRRLYMAAAKL